MTSSFEDRTESKLRFAELHLKELIDSDSRGSGDDFEIAHEESCLFHIVGAKDAFLQELNNAYNLELAPRDVIEANIKKALEKKKIVSKSFNKLNELMQDDTSWLYKIIEYRNIGTHRYRIPREFFIGKIRKVSFIDPLVIKGGPLNQDIPQYLKSSIEKMRKPIKQLRPLI